MKFLLASNVSEEVESGLNELNKEVSALTGTLDKMVDKLIDFGWHLLIAIAIFAVGKVVIRLMRKLVKNIFKKSNADAGGVLILLSKPFIIGDYVMINGEEGTVTKIDIVYTTLVKADNRVIKCPNGEVANNTIINFTNQDGRRVDVKFSIHYDADIEQAKDIVKQVIENSPYTLKDKPNDVVVMLLDESGVNLETRAWVEPKDYWDAYFYLNEHIKKELEKNDIIIPYNQLEVHVNSKG